MSTNPPDHHRDSETMERLKNTAAGIFARYGVDFATAKRAGGWTNATWIAGGLVLRMSVRQGGENIRREARLARLLPEEVGYPTILETGCSDGNEWSLSREIQGTDLGKVWHELDWDERTSALRQLWQKILAVHSVDIRATADLARKQAWFNATNAEDARAALRRLVRQGLLTSAQVAVLNRALDRFWETLPGSLCVLNHGDLTIENTLWHAGRVVSLLDFEFAVIAPAELDLNELVKCAFAPPERQDALADPDRTGLQQLRQAVSDLAMPVLNHPGGKELLQGYAILLEVWMLEDWLAHPEGEGPVEQWQPYRMLLSLADGQGGYLAPVLGRLDSIQAVTAKP
jgi:aminoglycoside phosphotransferase